MSDVLLEIADAQGEGATNKPMLQLQWRVNASSGRTVIPFASPVTTNMAEVLRLDRQPLRSWRASEYDRAQSLERTLLTLGRALGNALVDADYALLAFCEALERSDHLGSLRIAVLSDHPEVTAVPWELLILPDSRYVVAASGAAFVRAPRTFRPFADPACTRELGGSPENALGYLRLDACASRPGLQLEDLTKSLTWQNALRVALGPAPGWSTTLPEPGPQSWEILHWSGAIKRHNLELSLSLRDSLGNEQTVSARDLLAVARALGTELMILEPTSGGELLHDLATAALQADIPNVLTVAEHDQQGWPSRWLHHLLECIGDGLGLQQAVVETRKRIQRATLTARQAENELPHAVGHANLLRHYSARDVVFFAKPLVRAPEPRPAHPGMFGFEPGWQSQELGDAAALRVHEALTVHGAALVHTAHGGGLTHALQRTALLSLLTQSAQRAYCWDFARVSYSVRDVLEMVADANGETNPENVTERSVLASLAEKPALFVFDNFDVLLREKSGLEDLLALIASIRQQRCLCLVGTHEAVSASALPLVVLPPVSERDCVAMAAAHGLAPRKLGPKFFQLTEQLQGLPLLVERMLGSLNESNLDDLLLEASTQFGAGHERAQLTARLHSRRFEKLQAHWQRLVRAWEPLGPLPLQLLTIAVDGPGGERSQAGSELWRALGVPVSASCANAMAELQHAGFAVDNGTGMCLSDAALRFLRDQNMEPVGDTIHHALAVALCHGLLRLLSTRPGGLPNALKRNLLRQRAQLREQVEAALVAGESILATRTFLALFSLLQEAQLTAEASAWAARLLQSAGPTLYERGEPQLSIAWLSIAQRVPVLPYKAQLEHGADHFAAMLLSGRMGAAPGHAALLPLAVSFLQTFCDQTGDVTRYRDVACAAADLYRARDNKLLLAQELTALAAAEHLLGNEAERDRIEHELLHEFSYGESPASTKLQTDTLVRIARMRMGRQDHDAAEAALKPLDHTQVDGAVDPAVLLCRGDLAFLRQDWQLASEYICRLWKAALSGAKGVNIDLTAQRLAQLAEKLGKEPFSALYSKYAGDDTPTPAALGITIVSPA